MVAMCIAALLFNPGSVLAYSTGDTYPYKGSSSGVDPWNFYKGQCTSFVAWCLNDRNGIRFTNQYKGVSRWGNAKEWPSAARKVGITVDNNPAVGAVACRESGTYGHVAWVKAVNGNKVTIEEYNHVKRYTFSERVVTKGDSSQFTCYIHIKDLQNISDTRSTYNDVFASKRGYGCSLNQAKVSAANTFTVGDSVYVIFLKKHQNKTRNFRFEH